MADRNRDTRVLSMILLLRKLHAVKGDNAPLHIIGENTEDMTEKLAIGANKVPDFVNTQAIFARVLAQAAAYPMIVPSLRQLFDTRSGTAQLEVIPCVGKIPLGKLLPWGLVREMVSQGLYSPTSEERRKNIQRSIVICLGFLDESGVTHISPGIDDTIVFRESCRIIALRRHVHASFLLDSSAIVADMESRGVFFEREGEMFSDRGTAV